MTVTHLPNDSRASPTPILVFDSGWSSPDQHRLRALAPLAGQYIVRLDGEVTTRVAAIPEREVNFRPRQLVDSGRQADLGGAGRSVDASERFAMGLVALVGIELVLRIRALRQRSRLTSAGHGNRTSAHPA